MSDDDAVIEHMDCIELVERVTEYLDGAMTDTDRARFEQHVGACPGCVEILDQFRAIVSLTGALRPTDVERADADARTALLDVFRAWRSERA